MDRAVEAKLRNPAISAEEALRIGGYKYPKDYNGKRKSIVDSDNISIRVRKDNLMKRLRKIRNAVAD